VPTLAQARRSKSMTQRQLAEKLGVQRTLVSSWERGVHRPGPKNLAKLCEILGVPPDELELNPTPVSTPSTEQPEASAEERRRQMQAYEEEMGYVDSTWLRGGRYDVDPAFHEKSTT
jgi:transcriptional regulator with XRE-family HTH domain